MAFGPSLGHEALQPLRHCGLAEFGGAARSKARRAAPGRLRWSSHRSSHNRIVYICAERPDFFGKKTDKKCSVIQKLRVNWAIWGFHIVMGIPQFSWVVYNWKSQWKWMMTGAPTILGHSRLVSGMIHQVWLGHSCPIFFWGRVSNKPNNTRIIPHICCSWSIIVGCSEQ